MLLYFILLIIFPFFGKFDNLDNSFTSWTPETYPDSRINLSSCHIRVPSFVCDANNLLNDYENQKGAEYLQAMVEKIRRSTHCPCNHFENGVRGCGHTSLGFTISIAVFSKLYRHTDFNSDTDKKYSMSLFTETLRQRQKRGECNEDILITLAVDDGIVWTSLGSVAHNIISTELINDISDIADSYFKKSKYTEGLAFMIDTYGKLLRNEEIYIEKCDDCIFGIFPLYSIIIAVIVIIITIIIVIIIIVIICKKRSANKRDSYTLGIKTGNDKIKTRHIFRRETQRDERKI
ncbi:TPM domain-containing protein [Strongyloides ratti]|uniref:TPM domain-containing protein n=1 Tax=Strongyloides ratti TaxID=34506 RepID=A0A090L5A1_STRRB|nr:TPM domain-containing protein [Strongyloides ratti]CEF63267.1 TPM domain-containing protein [Strongyloides ratti]